MKSDTFSLSYLDIILIKSTLIPSSTFTDDYDILVKNYLFLAYSFNTWW